MDWGSYFQNLVFWSSWVYFSFRFGFVDFSSPEAAAKAYDEMSGQSIDGRQVWLDFAQDKDNSGGGGGGGFGGRGKFCDYYIWGRDFSVNIISRMYVSYTIQTWNYCFICYLGYLILMHLVLSHAESMSEAFPYFDGVEYLRALALMKLMYLVSWPRLFHHLSLFPSSTDSAVAVSLL